MIKEAYYFSHDSNARQDDKIVALRMKHGWEGYGLFWAIIEKLRDASDFSCVKDYNLIAFDLRTDAQKIKSIIEDFNLFEIQDDRFFSCSLLERMSKREKSSLAGIKGNLIKYGHVKKEDIEKMSDSQIIELNTSIKSPRDRPEIAPARIINKRKINKNKENEKFTPPSLEEVLKYFDEKGYTSECAKKAYEYYDVSKWIDSKGNKVKNWKQKMISVWMKPENLKVKLSTIETTPKRKRL